MNSEEAKDIATALSNEGKISFDHFKRWWFMWRNDFSNFRNLVQMEMKVNKLVKQSNSIIWTYMEKVGKEVE